MAVSASDAAAAEVAARVEQLDEERDRVGVAEPRQRPGGPRRLDRRGRR